YIKQLSHLRLGQPDGFLIRVQTDFHRLVDALIDNNGGFAFKGHGASSSVRVSVIVSLTAVSSPEKAFCSKDCLSSARAASFSWLMDWRRVMSQDVGCRCRNHPTQCVYLSNNHPHHRASCQRCQQPH